MDTEWEATFWPINKNEVRTKLKEVGAILMYPERLMRRINLYPPDEEYGDRAFVRVRDEGDKITMSLKDMSGTTIEEQKEVELVVDNFDKAQAFLRQLGCKDKNYQETKRELWKLGDVAITIDEWPFLEPFIEVEGSSEEEVHAVSERLGYNWAEARFCSADKLYAEKYGVESRFVNRGIPRLLFDMESPFQTEKKVV